MSIVDSSAPPPIAVRLARVEELDALAAAVAPQPLLVRYEITAVRLARLLGDALGRGEPVLVAPAEEDAAPLGFAWFQTRGTFAAGGYLRLIAVTPGDESRGVGAALLDAVERAVAVESRHLFLLVSHWNDGARRFYARRGYDEVGCLPAFVRPDADEIICCKRVRTE
jgi:ribosomal protein S18 acetylase RimI-like enzyme